MRFEKLFLLVLSLMIVATGAAAQNVFPANGNVGLGILAPVNLLDVNGTARVRTNSATNLLVNGASDDAFIDLVKTGASLPSARIELEGFTSPTWHEGEVVFFTRTRTDASILERMRIRSNGDVVVGGALSAEGGALQADNSQVALRNPRFNTLRTATRAHACIDELGGGWFSIGNCLSDAEYARAVDLGDGFPETGDLVSLAPGDEWADGETVFAVTRSATPCDSALVGFISEPEYGASGQKLDESYLPLAQTGFFSVRVTMENGPIRRGDPIATSSVPGAGMRSIGACRIVGYALEDADKDGVIKVLARLGDDAGALVADLALRVEELESRLAALEK